MNTRHALLALALLAAPCVTSAQSTTLSGCEMIPYSRALCGTMVSGPAGYTLTVGVTDYPGAIPFTGGYIAKIIALFAPLPTYPDPLTGLRLSPLTCVNAHDQWTDTCTVTSVYDLSLHGALARVLVYTGVDTDGMDAADMELLLELRGEGPYAPPVQPPVSTVPEPATFGLIAAGLLALFIYQRQRPARGWAS